MAIVNRYELRRIDNFVNGSSKRTLIHDVISRGAKGMSKETQSRTHISVDGSSSVCSKCSRSCIKACLKRGNQRRVESR